MTHPTSVSASWVVASKTSSCPWVRSLAECNVTQTLSHKSQEGSVAPTALQCCKCSGYLSGLHEGILVHIATAGKFPGSFLSSAAPCNEA